jgi:hypothetical protein
MAFADPQSITISSVARSLPRTGSGTASGQFQTADANTVLTVSHGYGKRVRHTVSLVTKKLASDPLRPADNVPVSATYRFIIDAPVQGYSAADLEADIVGFLNSLTASTNANLKKLIGGEN